MHLIILFIRMPVTTELGFIVDGVFNFIQPLFGAYIHVVLINGSQKHFFGFVLIRAGTG